MQPNARPRLRFWFLSLVSVLLRAQELPSSLQLNKQVNLIQVPVVILDKAGHAVTDLNVEDVSVYDNGKLQKITRFRYLQGRDGRGTSEVAQGAAAQIEKAKEPHLLVVIPQLQFGSRLRALNALEKQFQQGSLGHENIAIVDNSLQVVPFTRDRDLLLRAVRKMRELKMSPCQGGPWASVAGEWMLRMRSMPGRKFLVIFSDGPMLDPQCVVKEEFSSGNSPWALLRLALDSNVAIYPIDPRGAAPVIPGGDASTGPAFGSDVDPTQLLSVITANLSAELSARRMEQSELIEAAGVSGGRIPLDVKEAFRMMREDSSYYELEYYFPNLKTDGALHRIKIKLRRSGLRVLAKEGYQAPAIRWVAK